MAKPLRSDDGQIITMDLPNDAVAREVADRLAKMLPPGGTIVLTDENGNEIYVAKVADNGPH